MQIPRNNLILYAWFLGSAMYKRMSFGSSHLLLLQQNSFYSMRQIEFFLLLVGTLVPTFVYRILFFLVLSHGFLPCLYFFILKQGLISTWVDVL